MTILGARPVEAPHHSLEDRLVGVGLAVHDRDLARAGIRALLRLAGEDPERDGLLDTPNRYLKAWTELTGSPGEPAALLARQFADVEFDQMVAVGPIPFVSLCEHHLLPFSGTAHVAYLPDGGVVGLSKIPRLLEHYARRPQVQERLTKQVVDALDEFVPTLGSACLIHAVHSCATMRGVRTPAPMTTSALTGAFKSDPTTRAEFLALAQQR